MHADDIIVDTCLLALSLTVTLPLTGNEVAGTLQGGCPTVTRHSANNSYMTPLEMAVSNLPLAPHLEVVLVLLSMIV